MTANPRYGVRDRSGQVRLRRLLQNLRSQISWKDLAAGLSSGLLLSLVLVGIRYQTVPTYEAGDIAAQDVRASQDMSYEDRAGTERRRLAARTAIQPVFDLNTPAIEEKTAALRNFFKAAREVLEAGQARRPARSGGESEPEVLREISRLGQRILSADAIALLLKVRFSPETENAIVGVLRTVLQEGVVADIQPYRQELQRGFLLRNIATGSEELGSGSGGLLDMAAARESLARLSAAIPGIEPAGIKVISDSLGRLLVPTVSYNAAETNARREAAAARVLPLEIPIKKGRTIVRSGDEVTPVIVAQLDSLRNLQRPQSYLGQFLGFFLLVSFLLYALWRYFVHHQMRHKKIRNHMLLILLVLMAGLLSARLLSFVADVLSDRVDVEAFQDPMTLYHLIPFALVGILVALLVDTTLGILSALAFSMLVGLYFGDTYIAAYALTGNLAGVFGVRQYRDRTAILKAGLTVGLANCLAIASLDLVRQDATWDSVMMTRFLVGLMSAMLASSLASMLLPPLEWMFKITTDIRLLEMSNLNAPILRRLAVEAPGTYHHSLMVGTLSEAAAEAIGANPLLVRVAAYYHDVGKIQKPEYFVENQMFGVNKHERLSPSMSSLILASHVKDGIQIAKDIGLAERIRDMIPQHHGTRLMTYFYQKAVDAPGTSASEVVETEYRYPGPKPQSKEAAIMMMADSIEAASRTLKEPSPSQIQGMIDRLADSILADHQLDECDITMREICLVKESFFKVLTGIYHRRIDYPGYDFNASVADAEPSALQDTGAEQAEAV